jgi:Cu+-exporting ATPase
MKQAVKAKTCYHCGSDCPDLPVLADDKLFCCSGCSRVYQMIHRNNLDNYYCLNENPGVQIKNVTTGSLMLLDDPVIAAKFILFSNEDLVQASFYLPQIHCSSCLWLLEHLREANPGVLTSRVNFTEKRIYLSYDPKQLTIRSVAELLKSVGYEPHIDLAAKPSDQRQESKTALEIGVAGFCFANIMLLSFPEYFGLNPEEDGQLVSIFRYLNLGLSLPVFGIGLHVFFRQALAGLRQKYLNIDAPVALAIWVTFIRSVYEILSGTGMGYLDSMSGIVFFMLIGRALQNKTNRSLQFNRDYRSYFPMVVQVLKGEKAETKTVSEIKEGDLLYLRHSEIIPVDGYLSKGRGSIDYSFITGESRPVWVNPGELVYAGGRVNEAGMELLAIKSFNQSGFNQLWNNAVFKKEKLTQAIYIDRLSKYFSIFVLGLAVITFIYWQFVEPSIAWKASTAILIIACPCALLLSSSFTYGHLIQRFAQSKFFVRNANVLEFMPLINHIVFDKTGTLTTPLEESVQLLKGSWTSLEKMQALSLMNQSTHPISQLIVMHESPLELRKPDSFKEWPGEGIEGWLDDHHLKIGNAGFTGQPGLTGAHTLVYILIDNCLKAIYESRAELKAGAVELLMRMKGYKLTLLSGDRPELIPVLQPQVPAHMKLLMGQLPQQKLDFIREAQAQGDRVMMVGDGLNDAGALKQSDIGVAVVDRHFSFSPACDALIQADQLENLDRLMFLARQAKYLIWLGFVYSILYNVTGIYFAVQGRLSPLIAAILMPLSSIGVMVLAFAGVYWICRKENR